MMNEIKTTYKQTSTEELLESLKNKMWLAFERGYLVTAVDEIDRIETELVSRGYTWKQIEAIEAA